MAVIDTGADASHPDLAGRIVAARDFGGGGPATQDPDGHGTHVASLACAAGGNGVGLAGAGLRCGLLLARTDFSDSSVAAAIVWAVRAGADAIVMSFGTAPGTVAPLPVQRAIDFAYARGVLLAAAAADEPVTDQGYPANVLQPAGTAPDPFAGKGVVVTAATAGDERARFAGLGTQISLAAYGAYDDEDDEGPRGIFGAFTSVTPSALELPSLEATGVRPPCACRTVFQGEARYAYLEGTSMATPMVAAVGALVRHLNPGLRPGEAAAILGQSARRTRGAWTADLGWGILDGAAAVRAAAALDRTPPSSHVLPTATRRRARTVRLRWTGRDLATPLAPVSGMARYELWRRAGARPWRRVLVTTARSGRVRLRTGSRYAFATVAVGRAGNREALPARADVRVRALRPR